VGLPLLRDDRKADGGSRAPQLEVLRAEEADDVLGHGRADERLEPLGLHAQVLRSRTSHFTVPTASPSFFTRARTTTLPRSLTSTSSRFTSSGREREDHAVPEVVALQRQFVVAEES
jgi:hypothetical protein